MQNTESVRRSIAKISDVNTIASDGMTRSDDILLSCDLTSLVSNIGPNGTQIGTPVFSNNGMSPGGSGSVKFSNIDNGQLKWAGQIVCTVTTQDVSQYDVDASHVTGSVGNPLSAFIDVWSLLDSISVESGRLIVSNAEQLQCKFDTAETENGAYIHSAVHGTTCEICVWWEGSEAGILVDGAPLKVFNRVASIGQDNFTDIVIGADANGNNRYFTGTIKNIVISTIPPARPSINRLRSVQFFGDSYASHAIEAISMPRCSATINTVVRGKMMQEGFDIVPFNNTEGGTSVCDTGSLDLSNNIDAAALKGAEIVVFMAGNNDIDASDIQIADGSTGTDANYKSFINSFFANGSTKKVIITTAGSLFQDSVLNTAPKNARLIIINNIIKALPAWWDSANPEEAGFVEVVDLHHLLGGDLVENFNYKGQVDNLGNETIASGASPTAMADRHLSYLGEVIIGNVLAGLIL